MSGPHPSPQVRNAAMSHTPEEALGYRVTERTRFRLRLDLGDGREPLPVELQPGPYWRRGLRSLDACQRAWISLRSRYDLGMSQCSGGEVFDEAGQHVAHVSYNGRLWPHCQWSREIEAAAEAPALTDDDLQAIAEIVGPLTSEE